jgi:hypothetical protein
MKYINREKSNFSAKNFCKSYRSKREGMPGAMTALSGNNFYAS